MGLIDDRQVLGVEVIMCECLEYDDGSIYLCPPCAGMHRDTLKTREDIRKLINDQKDIPSDIKEIIYENLWGLYDD